MWFRTLTVAGVLVVVAACADREPSAPVELEESTGPIQAAKGGRSRPKPPPGITYDVTDLGALPPNTRSSGRGINENRYGEIVVVGSSWDDPFDEPTLWTVAPDGVVKEVVPLHMPLGLDGAVADYAAAVAITETGIAAGPSSVGPVYWDALRQFYLLPVSAGGGWANDVSLLGQDVRVGSPGDALIVGSQGSSPMVQAVYWVIGVNGSPPLAPSTLPPRAPGENGSAQAVNSQGTITGYSRGHGVVWHPDAHGNYQVCDLGPNSIAYGISEPTADGLVHVAGAYPTTDYFATVWTVDLAETMWRSPDSPAEPCATSVRSLNFYSEYVDVNAQGDAVGEDLMRHEAIVSTKSNGLVYLPSLTKAGFSSADAINDDGTRIAGKSRAKRTMRAVLWTRQ